MAKYVIEMPDGFTCDECPCRDETTGMITHGWLDCELAERHIPERYEAGEFSPFQHVYHDRPSWCPLVPLC